MSERVDLDRLADYVGGALDGTPDADDVRGLIAGDPAWESAYVALVAADAAVRLDLAEYAAQDTRMPSDVADRLAAVLRSTETTDHDATRADDVAGAPTDARPSPRRPATRTDPARPGTGRRRARTYAALSAVAAVVLVALGLLVAIPRLVRESPSASGDTAFAPETRDAPAAESAPDTRQTASGRDYRPGQFGALGTDAAGANAAARSSEQNGPDALGADASPASGTAASAPSGLERLLTAGARAACLQAIVASHGGVVRLVDYARFEGRPALVTLLDGTRTGGTRLWVVVVGPDCGQPPGRADERYSGPIA
jgi:hypothetical protein